jgi:hypothetical protein
MKCSSGQRSSIKDDQSIYLTQNAQTHTPFLRAIIARDPVAAGIAFKFADLPVKPSALPIKSATWWLLELDPPLIQFKSNRAKAISSFASFRPRSYKQPIVPSFKTAREE